MEKKNRVELGLESLDKVAGGALGFDPEGDGTYTMHCQFTGNTYYGVSLSDVIEISKFGATVPNTEEGERQIIDWAKSQGII